MEFMQRLAALVPRPRLHLIRFHGVLAPNAKLKSRVVPVPASVARKKRSVLRGAIRSESNSMLRKRFQ